jgi:hypothetical protein
LTMPTGGAIVSAPGSHERMGKDITHNILQTVLRILRLPFFLLSLILGLVGVLFFVAATSVGGWCEDALCWLGYRSRPAWLPIVLGASAYTVLGVAGPAYLGGQLIGWPGAILGPVLVLGAIAILGKW